jgi:molecular chaperone DnaJ
VPNPDLYAVLEVDPSASTEELKRAYRRLARQYHPDANDGDASSEARFKEVSQAYEILSDPERRANYDRFGSDVGAGGSPFGASSVQDIFDMFFGGMGGQAGQRSTSHSMTRPLARPARSRSPSRTVARPATGRDARRGPRPRPASSAPGSARSAACATRSSARWSPRWPARGVTVLAHVLTRRASTAVAKDAATRPRPWPSRFPQGWRTDRPCDSATAVRPECAAGRLFVHLSVQPDARFERHGNDLHHEAHIAFTQAALGASIEVPTLRASATIEVTAGSANGTVHRLRHEGVQQLHGRGRGDLYVHLLVDVPSELDSVSEDLLRQLAEHRDEPVVEPSAGLFHRRRGAKR